MKRILLLLSFWLCCALSMIVTTIGTFTWILLGAMEIWGEQDFIPLFGWIIYTLVVLCAFWFRLRYMDLMGQIYHDATVGGSWVYSVPRTNSKVLNKPF